MASASLPLCQPGLFQIEFDVEMIEQGRDTTARERERGSDFKIDGGEYKWRREAMEPSRSLGPELDDVDFTCGCFFSVQTV